MTKHILLVSGILLINSIQYAQDIIWQNSIGGSSQEYLRDMIQTSDGGFLLGGSSTSPVSGDVTEAGLVGQDCWLVKTDANGNVEWDKSYGGSIDDEITVLLNSGDDNYIVCAYSNSGSSPQKSEANIGGYDLWILKINSAGEIIWENTIGGSENDVCYGAFENSIGEIYVISYSYSGISGDKTEANRGENDYWIVKLNADGEVIWDKTMGGSSYEYPFGISGTPDGGFICTGFSETIEIDGDKTVLSEGFGSDEWLIKFDETDTEEWQKTLGGSSNEDDSYCIVNAAGEIVIVCESSSSISGEKSENSLGATDIWVVKTDADGDVIWDNTIGGEDDDIPVKIIPTPDEGFIIASISSSNSSVDKTENSLGGFDYWIIKLNSEGEIEWENTIGGSEDDYGIAAFMNSEGYSTVGGYSHSDISFDKTDPSEGGLDYWLMELCRSFIKTVAIDGATATSDETDADTWQWINCSTGIIPGATSPSYTALTSGDYAVIMTDDDCMDTSGCYTITVTGIEEYDNVPLQVYPNPSSGLIQISVPGKNMNGQKIQIMNAYGEIVSEYLAHTENITLNINSLTPGVYFIRYISGNLSYSAALFKE